MAKNSTLRVGGAMLGFVLAGHGAARTRELPVDIRAVSSAAETPEGEAYATGKALLALNDLPGALAQFRQALLAAPQSLDALNAVAVTYDRLGRPDLARGYYEAGLAIDPESPALLNNFGYSLYLQGDHAAAIALLRLAAASNDTTSSAAAVRTLTTVALTDAARPVFDSVPVSSQRIERTTDGEQRLIYAEAAISRDIEELAIAEATSVAVPWSMRDDRRLLIAVAADELAERRDAIAAAAAVAVTVPAPPAVAIQVVVPAAPPVASPVRLAVLTSLPSRQQPAKPYHAVWFDTYGARRAVPSTDARIGLDDTPRGRSAAVDASASTADGHDLKAFAALVRAERGRWV